LYHLPKTTFIRGSVTPVQIEATDATKRSNLSLQVEYEKILTKCKNAVLCSAVLKVFFFATLGVAFVLGAAVASVSGGFSWFSDPDETGRVAEVDHGVGDVFSSLLPFAIPFPGEALSPSASEDTGRVAEVDHGLVESCDDGLSVFAELSTTILSMANNAASHTK